MKILVTGGAGFIASNIADAYLDLGHEVVILDDLSSGRRKNLPERAIFHEAGIQSLKIKQIFQEERPDILCHHAAQIDVRKSVADPVKDAHINILGSLNLFEATREIGVKKIIFASTGGAIYGDQESYPAAEAHPTNPLSPYGIAKLSIEKYLAFYQWTYGIPSVILRYANVYGPRQNAYGEAGVVAIFVEKLLKSETPTIYGDGKQTRDYVFVGDVVTCNVHALDPKVNGIFNVGTGIETDVNRLASKLVGLCGKKIEPNHGPAKMGEQLRSCIRPGALQTTKPLNLDEGLAKTVDWFRKSLCIS